MKKISFLLIFVLLGCVTLPVEPVQWNSSTERFEAEYDHYLKTGTASIIGQAFLATRGGEAKKAIGSTVTLDPATTIGSEWWSKAGVFYVHRTETPPSINFAKARRITVADADGRFKFSDLPDGKYFIRTEVTWEIGGEYSYKQGGLVGQLIEVKKGQIKEIILNQFAK